VKVAGIVANGGTVELHTNKMIVGGTRLSVEQAIRAGRNNGAWNAPGLRSDDAATNPNHNTTLGVMTGAEYNSVGGTGTFGNLPYAGTDNSSSTPTTATRTSMAALTLTTMSVPTTASTTT
jgi:hypothetical protein